MPSYTSEPASDLKPHIISCWSVFSEGNSGITRYEIFPDSNAKLIFRFSSSACRMVLMGPIREKTTVEIDRASDYFGIHFRPGQALRLADINAAELVNSYAEIHKICAVPIRSLASRLLAVHTHVERQLIMETVIKNCLAPLVQDLRCRQATALLDACGGRLSIRELAGYIGIHVRSLERLFKAELGISPKQMTCLIRLRKTMPHIYEGNFSTMADLAHACGYADQSHMIREFKQFTGRLPGDKSAGEPSPISGSPQTRIVHCYRP